MDRHSDTETAWRVLHWSVSRNQSLMAVVAVLHLWAAITLLFARQNLFTEGTRPVFLLAPPLVWAVAFLVGGLLVSSLIYRVTAGRQVLTWMVVIPTHLTWLAASVIAVLHGHGSAMGVVFLTATLAWTVITALFVAMDDLTGKR